MKMILLTSKFNHFCISPLSYSKQFEKYIKDNDMAKRGNNYHTVAVIGA